MLVCNLILFFDSPQSRKKEDAGHQLLIDRRMAWLALRWIPYILIFFLLHAERLLFCYKFQNCDASMILKNAFLLSLPFFFDLLFIIIQQIDSKKYIDGCVWVYAASVLKILLNFDDKRSKSPLTVLFVFKCVWKYGMDNEMRITINRISKMACSHVFYNLRRTKSQSWYCLSHTYPFCKPHTAQIDAGHSHRWTAWMRSYLGH